MFSVTNRNMYIEVIDKYVFSHLNSISKIFVGVKTLEFKVTLLDYKIIYCVNIYS